MNDAINTTTEATTEAVETAGEALGALADTSNIKIVALAAVAVIGAWVVYTNYKALWAERKSSKTAK